MATRLDGFIKQAQQRREASRQAEHRDPVEDLVEATPTSSSSMLSSFEPAATSTSSVAVAPATLTAATASWLAITFALCYVTLPSVFATLGLGGLGVLGFWPQFPAFILASLIAVAGIAWFKPRVDLAQTGGRDPILAATLGGLGVWFFVQNAFLMPFGLMEGVSALTLLLGNVIEMTLLGTMFASFTKRPGTALALGAGFQLSVFALTIMVILAVL